MEVDQEFQQFQQLVILAGRPILVDPAERTSDLFESGENAGLSVRNVMEGLGKTGQLGSQAPGHYEMNRLIVYKNVSERALKYRNDPTDASWMPHSQAKTPEAREALKASMARFAPVIDGMYEDQRRLIEAEYPGYLATLGEPMIHPGVQFELKVSLNQIVGRFRVAVEHVISTSGAPRHIERYPNACCGIISELMGDYLNTLDMGEFHYICSMKNGASHAWLEISGLIVDITGDQFPDRPPIYVDKPDAWYAEWEEDIRHLAVHERSAFFYREERQFLTQVLEHMNQQVAAG